MPDLAAKGKGGLSTRGQAVASCDFNCLRGVVEVLFFYLPPAKHIALALGSGLLA